MQQLESMAIAVGHEQMNSLLPWNIQAAERKTAS